MDVERALRRWLAADRAPRSPLTKALLLGAADDWARGGAVRTVLEPYADEPAALALPLRLAAAMHRLVLTRDAPELALHYPTVGGTAPPDEAWPAALRVIEQRPSQVSELVGLPCQTNEVGRCVPLLHGLQHLERLTGRPVRLLEIGSSAGLNLLLDSFRYGDALGPAGSPCRLPDPGLDRAFPHLVERAGCDLHPLDPTSEEGRLRLSSSVWGDQLDRFERLRGALAVAAGAPRIPVTRAGAAAWLGPLLAARRADVVTVVWHSVVRQYVDPAEWAQVERLCSDAGVWRLAWEPEVPASAEFGLRAYGPGSPAEGDLLAVGTGHGPPVRLLSPG